MRIASKVILYKGSKSEQNITGICLKKKNKGFGSYLVLKYVINNESIIQKFPLTSPFVTLKSLEGVKKERKV